MRSYWLTSNLLAALAGAVFVFCWVWIQAHPASTSADSWRQARIVLGGAGVLGALVVNALVANALVALKGPARGWACVLLTGWLILAVVVVWWWGSRR